MPQTLIGVLPEVFRCGGFLAPFPSQSQSLRHINKADILRRIDSFSAD